MKKKLIVLLFLIVIFLIAIPLSFEKVEASILPTDKMTNEGIITDDLNQYILKQEIFITTNTITGIRVKTATFDRTPQGEINIAVIKNGNIVANGKLSGKDIKNNDFTNIEFDKKIDVEKGNYEIVIDLKDLDQSTPVTFYIYNNSDAPQLLKNDVLIKHNTLEMYYYTNDFSLKRFIYIILSSYCLVGYISYILKLIRNNK